MIGIEIFTQKSKQTLNIIVKTQPRVVDLKGPVNEHFHQPHFVARGVKLKKLVNKPVKVFLRYTVATGNCGDLLFNSTSRKGITWLLSLSIVK